MCRVLGISTSGYYAWLKRPPSRRQVRDRELTGKIRRFHKKSRGIYGCPRIAADLVADGERVSRKRVARLMKADDLQGVSRRKAWRTTVRNPDSHPIPDLVDRDFTADGPNRLWVADITYIPTRAGFLYLAVVLDVWSRRIVGWCMRPHLRTELVLEALNMALEQRRPSTVIHHSDQGTQYTSIAFGKRCKIAGVRPSTGSVGDCYDNAMCESFFATLECELIDRSTFRTRQDARSAVFEFIECFYNRYRRHSALGQRSPMQFEHEEDPACGKAAEILWEIVVPGSGATTAAFGEISENP
ncbi:UNVERIFIED_CONTAM: hypothetical protein GTU68_031657 [Idotea baltica]|nr:hypothetical protein [Idotea baltica]